MTAYAAGLRVNELVHVKLTDIDPERMMIRVEQGKGRKDRYTILSPRLLSELKQYKQAYQPHTWVFFGKDRNHPLNVSAAQKVYNRAKQRAGLQKAEGIYTQRPCFATHLLEAVMALCTIKTLSEFGRTHLSGQIGFTAVLHAWDQTLSDHFHLHSLIPQGALSFDQSRRISARKTFLFHVKALSIVFRGKFLDFLKQACDRGKLQFPGRTAPLKVPQTFKRLLKGLRQAHWAVYAKKPSLLPTKSSTTWAAIPTVGEGQTTSPSQLTAAPLYGRPFPFTIPIDHSSISIRGAV